MPRPQTYPPSPTLDAVRAIGGVTEAARLCGVTLRTVQQWLRRGTITDAVACLTVARAAGVDPWALAAQKQGEP